MNMPYAISVEELCDQLNTKLDTGLAADEVQARIKQFGLNRIEKNDQQPWWRVLLGQLKSPIVYLLAFAAAMSFYFNEWLEGIAILAVILINTVIGFYMEFQAGRSMEALQKFSSVPAKVLRESKLSEIDADNIVPGDIIFLEAGDMIPAEARIGKLSQLQVNESTLTGESIPVEKHQIVLHTETTLAEQSNMLFKGTFVTKGNVWAIVTGTGMQTELGKIAHLVQHAEQSATPLEKKLEHFSKKLIKVTVILVLIIFFSGWIAGHAIIEMINTSIALAVAAIPEGLPIVATLGLARGMMRMARQKVIVKKLSAVETLGGTSVICTDKTGTLTENLMTVKSIVPVEPENGHVQIIRGSILCNTADLSEDDREVGDPLETALLKHARQFDSLQNVRAKFPKIREEPFSSDTKRMITVHQSSTGFISYAKGAVEEILKLSSETDPLKGSIQNEYLAKSEQLASSGYKVIAIACRTDKQLTGIPTTGFTFLGIIGLVDPLRPEVLEAIAECKSAGIKVVMVTGDHPHAAKEIGSQLGLVDSQDEPVIMGADMKPFDNLTQGDKQRWLSSHIFARVTPSQKLDLIRVFQENGEVVGMTGDGVNDAPALKKANIGIAMGLRGTQVAQDVADMVLKDDAFPSIVIAIRQGRVIFDNIRKFVIFLLSCNLSELFTIAVTAVLNLHFQLFPLQILFINLVTDVLPALAIGMTPGNANVMKQKPRSADQPLIEQLHWKAVIIYAIVISASSMGAVLYSHYALHTTEGWNPKFCNNILFFTLIMSQLLHVFNMNSSGSNFFKSEVVRNKYVWSAFAINLSILVLLYKITPVREVLSIYLLSFSDWMVIIGFSLLGMIINQVAKKLSIIKQ